MPAGHITFQMIGGHDAANHLGELRALYREVYLRMYRQLKPLYRRIRAITGYPA